MINSADPDQLSRSENWSFLRYKAITMIKGNGYAFRGGNSVILSFFWMESTLKEKTLLPLGANSFLSE